MVYQPELLNALYPEASRTENSQTEILQGDHVYDRSDRAGAGPVTEGATTAPSRPAKLSKVHFSRKFQGKVHLNFWLSGSPISPYFHPKNLPIPPKVYLLKVQGTKSKASIDFLCPLCQVLLSSLQQIRIQTLLSPL